MNGVTAYNQVVQAIKNGDENLLSQMWSEGLGSKNFAPGANQDGPIFRASMAFTKHPNILKLFLSWGISPDQTSIGRGSETAVFYAVREKNPELARTLIDAGANVNRYNQEGLCPLAVAVKGADIPMLRLLVNLGANPNAVVGTEGALVGEIALRAGRAVLNELIKCGLDWGAVNQQGDTILRQAINTYPELLGQAAANGANLGAINFKGESLWLHALAEGSVVAMTILQKHGVDPGKPNIGGHTIWHQLSKSPLHHQIYAQSLKHILDFLLEKSAHLVDHPNSLGVTPLMVEIERQLEEGAGQLNRLQWFLDHGADINWRDINGATPLMRCIDFYNLRSSRVSGAKEEFQNNIVQWLLDHGADPNIPNKIGRTPLMISKDQTLKNLVRAGSLLDAVDQAGETALMIAASNENGYGAQMREITDLLEAGADASLMSRKGFTALDLSEKNMHTGFEDKRTIRDILAKYQEIFTTKKRLQNAVGSGVGFASSKASKM